MECLVTGLNRSVRATDPPGSLTWETAPLETDVDGGVIMKGQSMLDREGRTPS